MSARVNVAQRLRLVANSRGEPFAVALKVAAPEPLDEGRRFGIRPNDGEALLVLRVGKPKLDGKAGGAGRRMAPSGEERVERGAGVRERRAHRRIAFANERNRVDPAGESRSLAKGQHGKRRDGGGRKNATSTRHARLPGGAAQTLARRRRDATCSQRDNDAGRDA
jgi:hypothetical protein